MKILVEVDAEVGIRKKVVDEVTRLEVVRPVPMNANWFCRFLGPEGIQLRGRFDPMRCPQDTAKAKLLRLPVIPGQRLWIDTDLKVGKLIEPLRSHDDETKRIVAKMVAFLSGGVYGTPGELSAKGDPNNPLGLGPLETTYDLSDERAVPTWLYHVKRGVSAGVLRLIDGTLPDKIPGRPKKRFDGMDGRVDPIVAMRRRDEAHRYATMSKEQQADYERMLSRFDDMDWEG